jgi:hypothetical protein
MHDKSILLRDGSVILVGGRISPIHLCNQLLRIEFIPVNGGPAEPNLLCTDCGDTPNSVCDQNENVCPEEYILVEGNHSERSGQDNGQKKLNTNRRQEDRTPSGNISERQGNNLNTEGNNHNVEGNNCEKECRRPSVNYVQLNSDSVRPDDKNRTADQEKLNSVGVERCKSNQDVKTANTREETSSEEDIHKYSAVRFQEVSPSGDVVSPRWRHAAVLIEHQGKDSVKMCALIVMNVRPSVFGVKNLLSI